MVDKENIPSDDTYPETKMLESCKSLEPSDVLPSF